MAFQQVNLTDCNMTAVNAVEESAPSILPADKKWKLVWNDEFDGPALDESKWNYRLNFWGYRSPAFTTEGVEVSDGTLKINLIRKLRDDHCAAIVGAFFETRIHRARFVENRNNEVDTRFQRAIIFS